jgi:hypothetical protein
MEFLVNKDPWEIKVIKVQMALLVYPVTVVKLAYKVIKVSRDPMV